MGADVQSAAGDRELISERILVEASGNAPAERNVSAILRDAGQPRPQWRRRCVSAGGQISGLHVVLDEQDIRRSIYHRPITGSTEGGGCYLPRKSRARNRQGLARKVRGPIQKRQCAGPG